MTQEADERLAFLDKGIALLRWERLERFDDERCALSAVSITCRSRTNLHHTGTSCTVAGPKAAR